MNTESQQHVNNVEICKKKDSHCAYKRWIPNGSCKTDFRRPPRSPNTSTVPQLLIFTYKAKVIKRANKNFSGSIVSTFDT